MISYKTVPPVLDGSVGDLTIRNLEAPKPKKKRTQVKKMSVGANNEYELLLTRINAQLRLCSPLPRSALEPLPRNDRSSFTTLGVSDLPDRKGNLFIIAFSFSVFHIWLRYFLPFD